MGKLIPFDLEAFKKGQKALTRDGGVATFVGVCEECVEFYRLLVLLEGDRIISQYSLDGAYKTKPSVHDLVAMVSSHQHLIDSYDPEDTWQFKKIHKETWDTLKNAHPQWRDDYDYRIHPHNDLIKAWKKGAKIEAYIVGDWIEEPTNPDWYEDTKYRIKPDSEFTYPIYKISRKERFIVKFTSLNSAEIIMGYGQYITGVKLNNLRPHTDDTLWADLSSVPQTKTVYEWMWKDVVGCWHVSDRLREVQEASSFYGNYTHKKTGRSFEVEV